MEGRYVDSTDDATIKSVAKRRSRDQPRRRTNPNITSTPIAPSAHVNQCTAADSGTGIPTPVFSQKTWLNPIQARRAKRQTAIVTPQPQRMRKNSKRKYARYSCSSTASVQNTPLIV